jgi:FdhD protein
MRRDADVPAARREGTTTDVVVREEPLTVRLAARGGPATAVWTTLRTPGHDLDLALGWCVAEGLVAGLDDVVDVHHCTDAHGAADPNTVTVRLDTEELPDLTALGRRGTSTAACGLCGRDQLHALLDRCPPAPRQDVRTSSDVLDDLLSEMRRHQSLFATTGGCHAAGLATADGRLLAVREDVGRHNAVDAAVGAVVRAGARADVLVLSGRAGYELVAKAVAARIAVVASVGAATDLAVATATAASITLVTFVGREHGGTVLAGAERLDLGLDLDLDQGALR